MTTKTITVTNDAYEALKYMKGPNESFSDTILRVAKRKPLSHFYGALSKESADKLEKSVKEIRKLHRESHKKRLERLVKEMK
ncbi:MAG: antitoxin VapB family protein [Candidatus Aenigmatarchaeota archaeon]